MKRLCSIFVAALAVMATANLAKAGPVNGLTAAIVPGSPNAAIDTSDEAVFMQNPTLGLTKGDVVVGFAQINQDTTPGNPGLNKNTIYAVFSGQVAGFNSTGTQIIFGATDPTNSESLQKILGLSSAQLPPNSFAAVFETTAGSFPNDLIGQAPPSGITNINGYLQNIATNGTYDFTAGFSKSNDYFFTNLGTILGGQLFANTTFGSNAATQANLKDLGTGDQFGSNFGGMSIVNSGIPFTFGQTLTSSVTGDKYQLIITASDENGAANLGGFSNAAVGVDVFGAGTDVAPTTDKSTFLFAPTAVAVPEPSSIVLLGCGLAGFLGMGLRRKKKIAEIE